MRMTQFQLGTVQTSDRMVRRSNPASGYPLPDDPHIARLSDQGGRLLELQYATKNPLNGISKKVFKLWDILFRFKSNKGLIFKQDESILCQLANVW